MTDLETLLHASIELAAARKANEHANAALDQAQDRIADLQHENQRLKFQILAKDMVIQALRDQQLPALLRRQAE